MALITHLLCSLVKTKCLCFFLLFFVFFNVSPSYSAPIRAEYRDNGLFRELYIQMANGKWVKAEREQLIQFIQNPKTPSEVEVRNSLMTLFELDEKGLKDYSHYLKSLFFSRVSQGNLRDYKSLQTVQANFQAGFSLGPKVVLSAVPIPTPPTFSGFRSPATGDVISFEYLNGKGVQGNHHRFLHMIITKANGSRIEQEVDVDTMIQGMQGNSQADKPKAFRLYLATKGLDDPMVLLDLQKKQSFGRITEGAERKAVQDVSLRNSASLLNQVQQKIQGLPGPSMNSPTAPCKNQRMASSSYTNCRGGACTSQTGFPHFSPPTGQSCDHDGASLQTFFDSKRQMKVACFYDGQKDYNWLANTFAIPGVSFQIENCQWPTTEHYYQCKKFEKPGVRVCQTPECQSLLQTTGGGIQRLANTPQLKSKADPNFNKNSFRIMCQAVEEKLRQIPDALLTQTCQELNQTVLIENAGSNDAFWGNGAQRSFNPDSVKSGGNNFLGRIHAQKLEKVCNDKGQSFTKPKDYQGKNIEYICL